MEAFQIMSERQARKEKIDDIEYTDSREAKDAMATEVVDNLILKQHTESTRITNGKIVQNISKVLTVFQGTNQPVVDALAEILVNEEDMKAEEAIILKSIILRQLDHHNIQRYYLLVTRATNLVLNR